MERANFSNGFEAEAARLQASQQAAESKQAQAQEQAEDNAAQLKLARQRMRQDCRAAAAHLESEGIPAESARSLVPLDGYYFKGHTSPPTKFKTATFPKGWVIGRMTDGSPTEVLTVDGRWMHLYYSDTRFAKKGDIKEQPYHLSERFGVDERGPYLTTGNYEAYYFDYPPDLPPPSLEDEFTKQIAAVLVAHRQAR